MSVHEASGMTELGGRTPAKGVIYRRFGSLGCVREDTAVRVVIPSIEPLLVRIWLVQHFPGFMPPRVIELGA